jgi:hypothetical protein
MFNEAQLAEKLIKIESLYLGATTSGERDAAERAMKHVEEKLRAMESQASKEWRLSTNSPYEKKLLKALLRRYGHTPFRFKGQKHSTVMVEATDVFINEILWPQYVEMSKVLDEHLKEVTNKIIQDSIYSKGDSRDEVRQEQNQISYH